MVVESVESVDENLVSDLQGSHHVGEIFVGVLRCDGRKLVAVFRGGCRWSGGCVRDEKGLNGATQIFMVEVGHGFEVFMLNCSAEARIRMDDLKP